MTAAGHSSAPLAQIFRAFWRSDYMDHIRRLARDVTVLAITHRTSLLTDADQVVRLTV